jgi:hypothetical protein
VKLPFDVEQFLDVFRAYNLAIWPTQVLLYAGGIALVLAALRGRAFTGRWIVPAGLAALWIWMGVVYQLGFFTRINPAARLFGAAFATQGALWLIWARRTPGLGFRARGRARELIGGALIVYAFAVYPLLNLAFGHAYPAMPTFGVPCPTTIATLGLLSWASPRPPWFIWLVPVSWALVGLSAAMTLGIREDLGLPVAAVLALAAQFRGSRADSP